MGELAGFGGCVQIKRLIGFPASGAGDAGRQVEEIRSNAAHDLGQACARPALSPWRSTVMHVGQAWGWHIITSTWVDGFKSWAW